MGEQKSNWMISKNITISSIVAVLIQTIALVWYISSLDASVSNNAREIARQEIRINQIERTSQEQAVMLARIDENILSLKAAVEALTRSLTNL